MRSLLSLVLSRSFTWKLRVDYAKEDAPLICETVDREERSSPWTRDIMTGLSASVEGTVHLIGTTTPSVVYLLVVTVSPAFGAVTSNTSSFWAEIPMTYNDKM